MRKKLLALALVFALVFTLCACGEAAPEPTPTPEPGPTQEMADYEAAVSVLPTEITYDSWGAISAALCMALDVSMDELFGLTASDSKAELREQNHAMALENAKQAGELKRLETANDAMADHLLTRRTIIYVLLGLCGFLAVSLAFYIFIDSRMLNSGIVINGRFTVLAWILVCLIIAAFVTVIVVMIAIVRMSRNKNRG